MVYIGQPFVQTFAAMFDYKNSQLYFAKNVKAGEGADIDGPAVTDADSNGLSGWEKFTIYMLVTTIIAAVIAVSFVLYRRRQ